MMNAYQTEVIKKCDALCHHISYIKEKTGIAKEWLLLQNELTVS